MDRKHKTLSQWRAALHTAILAITATLMTAPTANGQIRLSVPDESPSGPFYARIERGISLGSDGWIAIPFYRDPSCVRAGFNLLDFFDFENIPAIFSCPLTVSGFELWDPANTLAPRQSKLQGNGAVPIWFVSVADYTAALPGLTIAELLAMPSLMQGVATQFRETLHPIGGAVQNVLEIVARGELPDGRTFRLVAVEAGGELRHVSIEFK